MSLTLIGKPRAGTRQLEDGAKISAPCIVGVAENHNAHICIVTKDVVETRTALEQARVPFAEEEVLSEIVESKPGEVAAPTTRLAEAGVNMHSLFILAREEAMVEIGFTVDDPKMAKKALGI